MTTLSSIVVGGFVGTIVLTTVLRGANELGLTRMDIAFLLGTTTTTNRRKAKAIGYVFHFVLGQVFAFGYGACFVALGRSPWWIGALLGLAHAAFMGTVLFNVLLPVIHPRMGLADSAADDVTLIEAPGFLMLNYGRNTFLITLAAHVAYGVIVAVFAQT